MASFAILTKCQLQLERSQVSVGVVFEGVSTLDKVRIVSCPVWTVEIVDFDEPLPSYTNERDM
jgi:hypothetical protein